ncbi:hypothetical protein AK812_SmicGene3399 [Symbiodinium microadriaticum]|uniref:Uncharacterized protein n=1 Tax=Symbiodinium microadriaticum TaxID=2951 RepID=A0A1Q9EZ41_SYMMI|nr:hypothetical protein AK812_SmicGene3399 [Symbiodinium microadriaticum]
MKPIVLLVVTLLPQFAFAGQAGKPECPCIGSSSSDYENLQHDLAAAGFPSDYGIQGCQAYDQGASHPGIDCSDNAHDYCQNQWCYVDTSLCPMNRELRICKKNVQQPEASWAVLSYETCGFLNTYNRYESIYTACVHDVAIGNLDLCVSDMWVLPERALLVEFLPALRHDHFYLVVRKTAGQVSLYDRLTTPFSPFTLQGWMTVLAYLTAVSTVLWLALLCQKQGQYDEFLEEKVEWANLDMEDAFAKLEHAREELEKAHLEPRNTEALAKAESTVKEAALNHAKKQRHEEELEAGLKANKKLKLLQWSNLCQFASLRQNLHLLAGTWYDVWAHFLGQDMIYEGDKVPGAFKMFSLAFAFFSIVTLATYTASLASMLVAERQLVGEISSIEDAIARQYTLCVPDVLRKSVENTYGELKIFSCKEIQLCPREMQLGNCRAMIVSEQIISRMHAGRIFEADCKQNRTFCEDSEGNPRNDCSLIAVGYVLTSVPIAFPASERLVRSLSWASASQHAKGTMQAEMRAHSHEFPKSICDAPTQQRTLALGAEDLSGIVIISGFFAGLALVRFLCTQYYVHKEKQKCREKIRQDREYRRETLEMGLTTVKFKEDIIDLFTSKKYATRAALDIGAGRGSTTAALAVNFAVVVAIEKYWDLADEFGCCHLESNKLLRKDGSEITNIVRLHMDTLLPFAFANLVDQNLSAVVIDAQHDFESIARETFHVLRDIPCCVETIVYHDYCFEDVFQTILWFELSGLLTFQKFMGEPSNSPNCKSVGENLERAEGVAMKVNRRPLKEFHEKVEEAFRGAFTLGGSLEKRLNGTQWLLLSPHSSIGILTIHSRPRLSHLSAAPGLRKNASVRQQFDHLRGLGDKKAADLDHLLHVDESLAKRIPS